MKKGLLIGLLFGCAAWVYAQEDSRIFIHPGRETFVYFPSDSLQNAHTVTFFLPEKSVPLSRSYPVVVALGVVPKQAQEVAAFQQKNPALVVGINLEEKDYAQKSGAIVQFLSHELLPYVDSNYWTKTGPENRILAVRGKSAAQVALQVMQNPDLFGAVALISPGNVWEKSALPAGRTLVVGTQAELALAQQTLQAAGKTYGPDFAVRYIRPEQPWLEAVDSAYLWALPARTAVKKIKAVLSRKTLPADATAESALRIWTVLEDNSVFNYVPPQLRFSPPYLTWDPLRSVLHVLPGAAAGTVRVQPVVDNPPFSFKIKLKKPSKPQK